MPVKTSGKKRQGSLLLSADIQKRAACVSEPLRAKNDSEIKPGGRRVRREQRVRLPARFQLIFHANLWLYVRD